MDFVLSPATAEDEVFLAQLFHDVHAAEFAPLGLPGPALAQLLDMQLRGQRSGYAAQFPKAVDEIVWVGPEPAGRVLVNQAADELRLVDIALLGAYRGQGVGGRVVGGLCERARAAGLPLRLSVRSGSPAQRLYERLGFVPSGGEGLNVAMEFCPQTANGRAVAQEPAGGEQTREDVEQAREAEVEQGFTAEYFRTWTGRTVKARAMDGTEVELTVEGVRALDLPRGGAKVDLGDSFVVIFHGPASPVLASACAEIAPGEGEAMSIFLAPIGADTGGIQYEAVFNRMTPRESKTSRQAPKDLV